MEGGCTYGLDLSDPEILRSVLHARKNFVSEVDQGDILQSVPLSSAQYYDSSIVLPPVRLGPKTDLVGHPGYDRHKTVEYYIDFTLPEKAHRRLIELCWMTLKNKFRNNNVKLRPFIEEAYEHAAENTVESAWPIFQSKARTPWESDGTFLLKQRTNRKEMRPVTVTSAEGVNHSGNLHVPKGSIVRLHVTIITWTIGGMYGVSVKLADRGIEVLRVSGAPVVRQSFLPGNFYLCVRPDDTYEIRDACGHGMRVSFPWNPDPDDETGSTLLIDDTMADSIKLMEEKVKCVESCVRRSESSGGPCVHVSNLRSAGGRSDVVMTPTVESEKSWKRIEWHAVTESQ
jgi:hypothetical protein